MKKKLALILSIVLVLAAVICVFAFSASADEVPFAEQQANDVWKAATNKVTSVKINGVTANATATPVELSTLTNAGFTSGTYTLVEGVLTLDAPVHTLSIGSIVATGDLKIVVNNGDWRGTIRNDSATTDACLIVTSETGHKIVTSNANTLRSKGWLIVYGNVGLNIDRATGQAIVKENASGSVIIAPEVDSVIKSINGYNASNAPAYHPTIEVRGGDLIFAGSAKVSIQNDTATNANTAALLLTSENTTGSVQVIEDVSLDITTAGLTPIHTFGNGLAGKDAILINTTGTVKMAATAFDCVAWGQNAMIQADTGSIRISDGKLLMSQHIATQAGGAAVAIYANNGGGGTTNYTDGVYVEGSAELVVKQTSVPTTPYVAGIWVNGGVVNVSGDAKLTVQTPATSGSNWAINVKLGAVNVSGNAKVHLTSSDRVIRIDLDNSKSGSNRTGLWNTISDESRAYWTDNGGIHVTGGQVDVISRNSLAFDTIDSIGDQKGTWTENFDFSGGVVLARVGDSSDYIFGAAFDSQDDISNAAFVGNFFRDTSATWSQGYDRSGKISAGYRPEWAYFAKDATYTYYNGISEYADFFGAASNEDAAIVDVTYDANGAATYTYTLPYTTTYKIGNNVAKFSKNTKINSAKPLSIAMSTEAASAPDGYVLFTETDGTVYYIFDDATDAVATTHVAQTGTITYDAATQNVTLNGVIGSYFATNIPGKMAINVSGVNVINGKFEVSTADDSSVTFSGTAADSLTVNPTVQYGFVSTRDTILAGAFTLNINSTREDALHISGVEHDLTVQDAVVLNVVTTHSAGRAIRSAGDMYVTGGTVNATAPTATINSWNADSDLFISQAEGCTTTVIATATNGSGTVSMTGTTSNIEISGGTLKAYANGTLTGDNSASVSCKAIYANTGLKISGNANVHAEGKSNLVRVDNGDLTLSGSAVLTAVSTFGAEDFAFAQTLSDGTQNEPATWTGVKRAFLRGTGVQIVHVAKGNLTVSDNASLSSTGANETAIQVQNGNLTINGNGSVSATLPTTYNENGKHTEVSSGDTVEAKGARLSTAFDQNNLAGTNAIRITNGNLVQNGGSLTAQAYVRAIYIDTVGKSASFNGGTANVTAASYSLNSQGNVVVNGGNVTSTSTGGDYAIYARDTVNISAGTVNATAGSKTSRSYAIYAVNAVNISGGDVHAIAGWSAIFADKVGVTVSGALWDDANKTGTRVVAEGTANSIYGKGTTGVAISGGTVVSTVTGEGAIRGSQLAISGGDLTLTAPKLALFSNTNDQANGGDRSLTVTGGKSVLNCTAEQAVACGALSISGDEYDAEAKTGTYFSATSGTQYAINADSVKISGGTVLAKAVTDAAINTNSLTVEGGTVTAISSASGVNYAAAVTTKNVNLTGGTLNIVLDKIQAASGITTVGLEIVGGATEANFKGGTLNISATNAVSTYRVYGIWTNAVDLIFDGTDVNIDITNVVGKNSYDCGIKVQKAYGIYVKGGSIDVRGTSSSRIFRLDDTGTSLEITGGELTGVVGYVVSHVGNTNSNAIVIKEGAKIDVYYATGRNQGDTAINTDGVATDIWMKNAAWTDNNHWLTTDNWEGKDSKVVLTLADQSNVELDLTNRTYPADAEIPMFALSAQNELIILDTTMVEPGKILRVHSKGDLKLNISKDVTVNLGNASTAQPLNANGVLTLEGAGTLNIVSGSAGIYAVDGFSLSGLTVKIDAKDNAIQIKHGDAKIDGATVTIDADLYEGIRVVDGDLYINDSTVTVTAMREAGIHTDAGDYFQTNSNVTVTLHGMDGNAPYNNGLMNGGTLIANGGNITVTGGSLTVNSQNCNTDKFHPVHATGDITFKSTTVLVDAPLEQGAVVFAPKTLTIDNSYVKVNSIGNSVLRGDAALVISGNAWDDDAKTGTYVEAVGLDNVICGYGEGLTINGGTVKATATKTNALRGSDITINGGDITANAGTSGGIFTNTAPAKITIAGGKVVSTVSGSKALDTVGNVEIKNAAVVELTAANEKATEIDGTLFIGGTAQVTAIANSNSQTSTGSSNTLYVAGKVTITDNANVTVKAPYRNRALCAVDGLVVSGNAVVNASVHVTQNWGAYAAIHVTNGMTVEGNAVINADAGSENTIHVYTGDYVQKGNTTVNAAITHTSGSSNGKAILVENGAFNLESGKVNITTTSSKFGALMAKDANISGGSVSINAVLGGSGTTDSIDTDYAAGIVINAADATKGLKISNDAEVIVKATNSGYVGSAVIINGGVLDVSDEAKFAVYAYGSAASYGAADANSAAITFYPGTMNVSDNAKVYLYNEFDRGLRFLTKAGMDDSWKTASGLRVSGGQLEIYSNGNMIPVGAYGGIGAAEKGTITGNYVKLTGGVVLLHSDTNNYMYDSAFGTKPANYAFVGGIGRTNRGNENSQWDRSGFGTEWAYWGLNESYQFYDPLNVNKGVLTSKVSDTEWLVSSPAATNTGSNINQGKLSYTTAAGANVEYVLDVYPTNVYRVESNPILTLVDGQKYTGLLQIYDADSIVNFLDGVHYTSWNNGMITYAPNGDATFNNVSGVKRVYAAGGDLNVKVNGTNTISGGYANALWTLNGSLSLTGASRNDSLTVDTTGAYAVGSQTDTFKATDLTLNIKAANNGIHIASNAASSNPDENSAFIENTALTITTTGYGAVRLRGTQSALNLSNSDVVLNVTGVANTSDANGIEATGVLNVDDTNLTINVSGARGITTNGVNVTGNSVVTVDAFRVGIYARGTGVTITDNAQVTTRTSKNTSSTGGVYDALNSNYVNILVSDESEAGYPKVTAYASSENAIWAANGFNMTGGTLVAGIWSEASCNGKAIGSDGDITISGGDLTLTEGGSNATHGALDAKNGNITISGDAVVNVTANNAANAIQALNLTVSDDANVTAVASSIYAVNVGNYVQDGGVMTVKGAGMKLMHPSGDTKFHMIDGRFTMTGSGDGIQINGTYYNFVDNTDSGDNVANDGTRTVITGSGTFLMDGGEINVDTTSCAIRLQTQWSPSSADKADTGVSSGPFCGGVLAFTQNAGTLNLVAGGQTIYVNAQSSGGAIAKVDILGGTLNATNNAKYSAIQIQGTVGESYVKIEDAVIKAINSNAENNRSAFFVNAKIPVSITGDSVVTVVATDAKNDSSLGDYRGAMRVPNLTIDGNAKVYATIEKQDRALWTSDNLVVGGNATLVVRAAGNNAIQGGNINFTDNAKIYANVDEASSYAVDENGLITDVNLVNPTTSGGLYTIQTNANFVIDGNAKIIAHGVQVLHQNAPSGTLKIQDTAEVVLVARGQYGIRMQAGSLLIEDDAKVYASATSNAIYTQGENGAIGDITIQDNAKVKTVTTSGYGVNSARALNILGTDDMLIDIDVTAYDTAWNGAVSAPEINMTGGNVDIDIDCAPFDNSQNNEQRVITAINVQGGAYDYSSGANFSGGKVTVNMNNNYNDPNYSFKDGEDIIKNTNANRTFVIFGKYTDALNIVGTDFDVNVETAMKNGNGAFIHTQANATDIKLGGGSEINFWANGNINALFVADANESQILIDDAKVFGAANYFWSSSSGQDKVLTITPKAMIDFFCYSGDSRTLGTYNSFNQTYYNWYVDDGVEYLHGCALDDNSQFVTTANAVVDGAASQVEIKVKEGSQTNTYVLNAKDRFYGGNTPETAKAYYTPYGLLYVNNLAAQSVVANGDMTVELDGTNTLVKNGGNALQTFGDLAIGGEGVLEMSGTDYVLYILGNEIEIGDKADVKIISTKGNAIHINTGNQGEGHDATAALTLKDDAKLVVEATEAYSVGEDGKVTYTDNGRGIYMRATDTSVNVLGNSVLDITSTDQGIYVLSNVATEGMNTKATINIGENAKVNIESATAFQTNGDISAVNISGNAVVDIDADRAATISGADTSMNVGGNAKVNIAKTTGDAINISSGVIAPEGVKQSAAMNVSGNATVFVEEAGSCGARIQISAKDENEATVPGTASFVVSGTANVDMSAFGQVVYLHSLGKDTGSAIAKVADQANVTLTNVSETSQYGSALTIYSYDNNVEFTTTGEVNIVGKSAGWSGALYVNSPADGKTNVLIKDAKVNVTNIQSTSFETLNAEKKNTFAGELSNAMNITGTGEFVISGDAVVNAYAERSGEKYNNRAHGLFLHPGMSLKIADNAEASFSAGGDSKANTGAGIHLKESDITVTDNATLRASASGTAVAGITFEGESGLTVNKYGAAFIDGGKDASGIRGYTKDAKVVIEAKDGARVLFTGAPAMNLKNGTFEISTSETVAGADKASAKEIALAVVQRKYEEYGYVLLKGHMRNPNTSDYVITSVVIAAIVAAAAAVAVVVVRKKKSQD